MSLWTTPWESAPHRRETDRRRLVTNAMDRENDDNLIDENDLVEQDYDAAGGDNEANGDVDPDELNNIVPSGDISAQEKAAKSLNTVRGVKDKKIANENRSTTPYMTKYERARVLGTRALQIRYAGHSESNYPGGQFRRALSGIMLLKCTLSQSGS